MGTGTFALSDDDHRSVCDPRRVSDHRLKKSLCSQEPHLVHHLVERGSCGDHGRSIYPRYGRARALGGRCTCAHSRCGRPCSADAVGRATEWQRESVPTRFDAGLKSTRPPTSRPCKLAPTKYFRHSAVTEPNPILQSLQAATDDPLRGAREFFCAY